MKKFRISTLIFSLATIMAFSLGLANSADATVWRLASKQPADSQEGRAFEKFAELVEAYTGGKIKVKVYPSEQLGKTEAALEQLQKGTIHVYPEAESYLKKWEPNMAFTNSPFVFASRGHYERFLESQLVRGWLKNVEEKAGIAVIGRMSDFVRGPFRVLASSVRVKSLDDVQGLKLRMFPNEIAAGAWAHLGAEVRVLGWTETYEAISRGIVQAVTSPAIQVEEMRFNEVAPHITRVDSFPQAVAFMVNAKTYRSLSPELKAAVDRAHHDAAVFSRKELDDLLAASLKRLTTSNGTYDEIDLAPFVDKAKGFYEKLDKKGKLPTGFWKVLQETRG